MNDYTAHDIHRLDQAYPDSLADIEAFTGDPKQKASLAAKGPEVFAAELTRDLAASATSPMSLAAWAAVATVRLMQAGKAWEEDTDAAWAKVDELTAALAKTREQAATYANEVGNLTAENARVRQQRDQLIAKVEEIGTALDQADEKNAQADSLNAQYHGYGARLLYAAGKTQRAERLDPQGTGWTQGDNFHADDEAVAR